MKKKKSPKIQRLGDLKIERIRQIRIKNKKWWYLIIACSIFLVIAIILKFLNIY